MSHALNMFPQPPPSFPCDVLPGGTLQKSSPTAVNEELSVCLSSFACPLHRTNDGDDVSYYVSERLKLGGETENMGVCTKERKGITAEVLMTTPCTWFDDIYYS